MYDGTLGQVHNFKKKEKKKRKIIKKLQRTTRQNIPAVARR